MRKILLIAAILICCIPVTVRASDKPASKPRAALKACKYAIGSDKAQALDAQCGTLTVPEDWTNPTGAKLTLKFTVLPPTNKNASGLPIFHLEGGPGGAAIDNFSQVWYVPYEGIREEHAVVLMDQRGTGTSGPLACTEQIGTPLTDIQKPITLAQETDAEKAVLQRCFARIAKRTDPRTYTSNAAADDLDALRETLGYDQIDVFGNSYGTSLAQTYLRRYGEHVAGMVLDSVTGPWNRYQLEFGENVEASFGVAVAICAADAACNKAYPKLNDQFTKLMAGLKAKPVSRFAGIAGRAPRQKVLITDRRFARILIAMLYRSDVIPYIPQLIQNAVKGNYDSIALSLLASAVAGKNGGLNGMYFSIECSEVVQFYTEDLLGENADATRFTSADEPRALRSLCDAWPSAELNEEDVAPVVSDRPVLILSGGLDPVTPVRYGEETHTRLPNSTLAVFPYQAHGVIVSSACGQEITRRFFDDPTAMVDKTCIAEDTKLAFVGASKPVLAAYTSKTATFSASVPKGWTPEPDGALTFFSSKDAQQTLAYGTIKKASRDAQTIVLDQLKKRYSLFTVRNKLSVSTFTVYDVELSGGRRGNLVLNGSGARTIVSWVAASNVLYPTTINDIFGASYRTLRAK